MKMSVGLPFCALVIFCYLVTATSARPSSEAGNNVNNPATEQSNTGTAAIRCGGCNLEGIPERIENCHKITTPGNEPLSVPLNMTLMDPLTPCHFCAKGKVEDFNFFGCVLKNGSLVQQDNYPILEFVTWNLDSDAEQCHMTIRKKRVCVSICNRDRCNIIPLNYSKPPPSQVNSNKKNLFGNVHVFWGSIVAGSILGFVALAVAVVFLVKKWKSNSADLPLE